jgi:hypothetical protein
MRHHINTLTNRTEALEREFRSLGFTEGAPAHIPPAIVATDLRVYRHLSCPECGHRAHTVTPFHRGADYRLLCSCRKCGGTTEA